MTIRKKLYAGFGLTLVILAALFIVNFLTGYMEKSARNNASAALDNFRAVEFVRYQIMLNRVNLDNFLLSGDPRDEDKVNKGLQIMSDLIKAGQSQASSENLRSALLQVESTETSVAFRSAIGAPCAVVPEGRTTRPWSMPGTTTLWTYSKVPRNFAGKSTRGIG